MDAQNPPPSGPIRLPLFAVPSNRQDTPDKDARLINGYVEKEKDGDIYIYKRGGTALYATIGGTGYGVYNWNGNIYSIFGGQLYKDGVAKGAVDTTNGVYTWSSSLGDTPKLFFHNGVKGYTYDDAGGLVAEVATATIVTTGNTHTTAIIDNIPSTAGLSENDAVEGLPDIPAGSYIISVDSGTQVTINTAATGTTVGLAITFTTNGFQSSLVKGQAYLDGTTYVMTPNARVYGSEINVPITWEPLNYLTAQIEPDHGIFLAKQLAYVVAFKEWSTEFFYDAGNAVGSPLGPVQGAKLNHGCRAAGSVQDMGGVLLWISATREGTIGVQKLEGLKAQGIGTPAVERILQDHDHDTTDIFSLSFKLGGHRFYVVTFKQSNFTLVYDLTTDLWAQWKDTNGNYFPFVAATYTTNQEVILQHETDGKLYTIAQDAYTDAGVPFSWELYTPNFDGGTRKKKYLHRIDVIADKVPGSILEVRANDYDYDPTKWTNFRSIDLGRERPNLLNLGTFRRRAMHFRQRSDAFLRVQAVELQVELGDL